MRKYSGRDAYKILKDWDDSSTASERFAFQILMTDGFIEIDPSHPRGGPDDTKDAICKKNGKKYVMAAYFPHGEKAIKEVIEKFESDLKGANKHNADGIAFVTNQELTLGERDELITISGSANKMLELYHLERISSLLNSPRNYGIRLEFLGIEMTAEEQLSALAQKDSQIQDLINTIFQLRTVEKKETEVTHSSSVTLQTERLYYNERYDAFSKSEPIHKCSHCRYGVKIASRISNPYSILDNSIFERLHHPEMFGKKSIEVITCPKCGNVDKV